ncbi:hypothetical protein FACS189450_04820 [Spirochaetia bacterium]|nr:hypothetical protein FACS189450_04820 [Spirochaetia bacterium]GHU95142.1 hypothetical protein FACS189479_08520 [Spirochaetia bacterium]
MGARVKPVQPTEIRDIKIVREAIAQIRKPIPPEVEQRNKELAEMIRSMIRPPRE